MTAPNNPAPSGDPLDETSREQAHGDTTPNPAIDKLQDLGNEVTEQGRRLISESKDEAQRIANQQKDLAADFLHDVADAFHKGANELKEKGRDGTASLIDWTADEVGSLAEGLAHRTPGEMIGQIESFARREPALAAGAAFLVGFGLLRFLRSSGGEATPIGRSR